MNPMRVTRANSSTGIRALRDPGTAQRRARSGWLTGLAGLGAGLSLVAVAAPLRVAETLPSSGPLLSAAVRVGQSVPVPPTPDSVPPNLWQVPLAFEPADDRSPSDAGFVARGPGYSIFIGSAGVLLALPTPIAPIDGADPFRETTEATREASSRHGGILGLRPLSGSHSRTRLVRVAFEGARPDVAGQPQFPLPGRVHRLRGSQPDRWQTGLVTHRRVVYSGVYPGIDVAFYGNGRELEYDFVIAPGASPELARVRFDGVRRVARRSNGDLELATEVGALVQRLPIAYQEGPKGRERVAAHYDLREDGTVGFQLGAYDRDRPLVIDPVLGYATFVGGTGIDQVWDLAVDAAGAAFVTGETESPSFADLRLISTNAFQTNYQGGQTGVAGDAFVAKLLPDGTAFEWFTYLGGSDLETAFTITLANGTEPVVGGFTASTNFPTSAGAFQTLPRGETNRYTGRPPLTAFVTRLKADGSGVIASTLFGGTGEDQVIDLDVLDDGQVVAVGSTTSTNLPLPTGAIQSNYGGATDAFVLRLSADFTTVPWGTYLGGSARDSAEGVALDNAGIAHVVGITLSTNFPVSAALQATNAGASDAFVAAFRVADGSAVYATYLGGNANDYAYRAAVGAPGGLWVAGQTASTNFPVVGSLQSTNAGSIDGFLSRLTLDGSAIAYSTYVGGAFDDSLWDVAIDPLGNVHFTGQSSSLELPGLSALSLQSTNQGLEDLLISRLTPAGVLQTTFYGSPGQELAYAVAADSAGNTYVAGRDRSVTFPVSSTNVAQATFGGGATDGFVVKVAYEPSLTAAVVDGFVEVSWPGPNPGFILETAPIDETHRIWAPLTEPVVDAAGRRVTRLPLASTNCLFRLRWER